MEPLSCYLGAVLEFPLSLGKSLSVSGDLRRDLEVEVAVHFALRRYQPARLGNRSADLLFKRNRQHNLTGDVLVQRALLVEREQYVRRIIGNPVRTDGRAAVGDIACF